MVPSLALGTGEVTLLELTAAYGVFANQGLLATPRFMTRVEDADGTVIWSAPTRPRRAISPTTAFLMSSMLADVVASGTATRRARGRLHAAGGREDRHDRRLRGRLVRRLHAASRRRRVVRLRHARADHAAWLRRAWSRCRRGRSFMKAATTRRAGRTGMTCRPTSRRSPICRADGRPRRRWRAGTTVDRGCRRDGAGLWPARRRGAAASRPAARDLPGPNVLRGLLSARRRSARSTARRRYTMHVRTTAVGAEPLPVGTAGRAPERPQDVVIERRSGQRRQPSASCC